MSLAEDFDKVASASYAVLRGEGTQLTARFGAAASAPEASSTFTPEGPSFA